MGMDKISWWKTDLVNGEAEAAAAAIHACHISQGPLSQELETKIAAHIGVRHAIAVPSGSQGLLLTMLALGIGPGDEVIVPDMTWIATAHAAALLGAHVVLVDCLADVPLIDPSKLAAAITPRTRAIIVVHLAGRSVDMKRVLEIAAERSIPVIEDAAQALGSQANGKFLGTTGAMGVYSLGLAKLVACGQGGIVVCNDDQLYEKLKLCSRHGTDSLPAERYHMLGMNMKFSDILAAVALRQWSRIEQKSAHVRSIYERYRDGLDGIEGINVLSCDAAGGTVPLWTEIRTHHRNYVIQHLKSHGVESRPAHMPLHTARHLHSGNIPTDTDFPNATALAHQLLILPSGPDQPLNNIDRVIDLLRSMEPVR